MRVSTGAILSATIIGTIFGVTSGVDAATVFSSTQTGAQLATNGEVTSIDPETSGSSLEFTLGEVNSVFLQWNLISAASRSGLLVDIVVDYTPLGGSDNDFWVGLSDGNKAVGFYRKISITKMAHGRKPLAR